MSQIPFGEVRAWMFQDALPFWAGHGVDRQFGGFFEELAPDGGPTACDFKRVRVICRQTYVFSHAALLGWADGAALSSLGYEYLVAKARLPGGGWARRLSRAGAIIDPTPDLYDTAFVLFAMAWRYRASKDSEALAHAHATLDFIQQHMRAEQGGYWRHLPPDGLRLQNPHMHLAEACLAAFEASQDQRFLDEAGRVIDLMCGKIFDGRTLGERFDSAWRRNANDILEPGHHFEWAWILGEYRKLSGVDHSAEMAALARFAEGCVGLSQAVPDAVRADASVVRSSSRAWANTERIKAWLSLYEATGLDPRAQVAGSVELLFQRYFAGAKPGLWVDQFDADGAPMVEAVPASILYHLILAFAELLRLEPRLKALGA